MQVQLGEQQSGTSYPETNCRSIYRFNIEFSQLGITGSKGVCVWVQPSRSLGDMRGLAELPVACVWNTLQAQAGYIQAEASRIIMFVTKGVWRVVGYMGKFVLSKEFEKFGNCGQFWSARATMQLIAIDSLQIRSESGNCLKSDFDWNLTGGKLEPSRSILFLIQLTYVTVKANN